MAPGAGKPEPVSISDLYRIVLVSDPQVSPEGLVAYTVTRMDRGGNRYVSSLWLAAPGREARPLTGGPGDLCPSWSPDGSLLAFARRPTERGGEWGLFVVSPGRGEPFRVASSRFGFQGLSWSPDGRWVYYTSMAPRDASGWKPYDERDVLVADRLPVWFNGEGFVFDRFRGLFRVDPRSGLVETVAHGGFDVVAYALGPRGLVAYARTYDELRPYLHEVVVVEADGEERVIHRGLSVADLAFSPDGSTLALRARDTGRRGFATHFQVYTLPVEGGEAECLTCTLDRNVSNTALSDVRGPSCARGLQWGPDGRIYFQVSDAGSVHLYSARPGGGLERLIAPRCGVVDEFSVSQAGVAYTLMTPTRLKEVYLHRPNGGSGRLTGHNDAWHESRLLPEPRKYSVEASDGALVDLWVLKPPSGGGGRLPWILYIHGGPKAMFGCGFMHEFHVLAASGFAVVYSNPRGSDGYSEEFADIRGRYGERDYQDLMDVADAAPRLEPSLDPERAGVTGGSYGGFMTNWVVTHTDRFKAAVTQRSCSNWISKYGTTDIGWYFNKDQIALGKPVWEAVEEYWRRSPLRYAPNAKTPLLIIHALEDYRCYVDQALQFYTALKELGVEVKLALFPRENHDLSRRGRPRSREARLQLIVEWFKRHLSPSEGRG